MPGVDRAEQVPALPERVRGQVDDRLALEEQERQVVRGDVDRGDRHQRVDEAALAACGATARRRPSARPRCRAVEAGDEPDAEQQPERRGDLRRGQRADPDPVERVDDVCRRGPSRAAPWARPSNVTVPIITATNATVPGAGSSCGRPPSGAPQADDAVARLAHRHAREQVEVDRERLAAARPRLDAPVRPARRASGRCSRARRSTSFAGSSPQPDDELDPGEDEQGRPPPASARAAPGTAGQRGSSRPIARHGLKAR